MKKWIYLGLAVAVVGGGVFVATRGRSARAQAPDPALAAAQKRDLAVAAEAAGLVEPVRVVEVKSKASGEVLRVLVETGDKVDQGALLAEIDPRDVQSALEQAQADLESARVRAQVTEAQRARMKELLATATVTRQEYEGAVDAAAAARSAVVRSTTALRLARERRGDVTLRAPVAGTLLARTVEPGQIIASATSNVSGGTTLFKMADLSKMQVRAKVDETDIGRISPGQTAQVTVEAYPGRTFRGTVEKIEPQAVVEQNVTMFPVIVRLDNERDLLRPGMNAEVQVQIAERRDVVAVPSSAVVMLKDAPALGTLLGLAPDAVRKALAAGRPEGERPRGAGARGAGEGRAPRGPGEGMRRGVVFVQGGQQVEPRRVTLGLSDWEFTEVLEGLSAGEQVVLVSVAQLQREQRQTTERIQQRMGNGIVPGSGGPARGGGAGGRGGR